MLSDLIESATKALASHGDVKVFIDPRTDNSFSGSETEQAESADIDRLEFRAGISFRAFVIRP